jgi:cation diffusion facilitator family transporter
LRFYIFDSDFRIFLTGSYFIVELVAGVWLDSLSLQADAFHMASDIMGLLIALYAENAKVSKKTKLATYGFVRADAVGSLINTTFLLSTCFTITIDALARFREVEELGKRMEDSGIPLLIVASIGLGINIIGLLCFGDQMLQRSMGQCRLGSPPCSEPVHGTGNRLSQAQHKKQGFDLDHLFLPGRLHHPLQMRLCLL